MRRALVQSNERRDDLCAWTLEPFGLTLEAIGETLFKAFFAGELLSLYERTVALCERDATTGLRFELMFDPRDPRTHGLQSLPWELIRQPNTPEFLALNRRYPLIRHLAVPRAAYSLPISQPLRILVVAPNPTSPHLCSLDLERESRRLEQALRFGKNVEVYRPRAPTLAGIREVCSEREFHVLHFMGHGGTVAGQGGRVLFLENEEGMPEPVRGADLFNKLPDSRTLQLVVLNACNSASLSDEEGVTPLSSVAVSFVLGGIPAVVAMQAPISDIAAIAFSQAFYQRYAAGDSVEVAVVEGRQAIDSAESGRLEWATPVLFQRSEGALSEPRPSRALKTLAVSTVTALVLVFALLVARGWWIERAVAQGVADFGQGEWSKAKKSFQAALKLAPGRAEIHSNIAACDERTGDLVSAEAHYRAAVGRQPDSAEHLFNLGQFLDDREQFAAAYPYLLRATQKAPAWPDAHGELAKAALSLGLNAKARDELGVALRLSPESPPLHRLQGELEIKSGEFRAAILALSTAKLLYAHGERGQIHTVWLLAEAFRLAGDQAAACREIQEFRRLDTSRTTPWAPRVEGLAERLECQQR